MQRVLEIAKKDKMIKKMIWFIIFIIMIFHHYLCRLKFFKWKHVVCTYMCTKSYVIANSLTWRNRWLSVLVARAVTIWRAMKEMPHGWTCKCLPSIKYGTFHPHLLFSSMHFIYYVKLSFSVILVCSTRVWWFADSPFKKL